MDVKNLHSAKAQEKQINLAYVQNCSGNAAKNEKQNIPISEMPGKCMEDESAPYLPSSYTRRLSNTCSAIQEALKHLLSKGVTTPEAAWMPRKGWNA